MNSLTLIIKRSIPLIAFVALLGLTPVQAGGVSAPLAQGKVPLKQTWGGENISRDLQAAAPPGLYIADQTSWAKLWQAWRGGKALPRIDFASELIVFCTSISPNSCGLNLALDAQGDLNITSVSTLIASDAKTFNYQIGLIERAGIKSIAGRPLTPGHAATSKGPDDDIVA